MITGKEERYIYVKQAFEQEGYTLLTEVYVNSAYKLKYVCPNNHTHSITWENWQQGYRCPCSICTGRPTITTVAESFASSGCVLISDVYHTNKTVLHYICGNGSVMKTNWKNWQQRSKCDCAICRGYPTIDSIIKSFSAEGYTLLTTKYINNKQKLEYICPNGHHHGVVYNAWDRGNRCPYCSGNRVSMVDIERSFKIVGYTLLTTVYKNNFTKLNYICPNNSEHSITWNDWSQGARCPCYECQKASYVKQGIKMSGQRNPSWKGGISFEPYCEAWKDQEYKKDIRDRDGNRCLNPYCNSPDAHDLTIHHIDYNKKNCEPGNLITICRSCNSKANKDRAWHMLWYQSILKNRSVY